MTNFIITMGEISGEYEAADREEALDKFAQDAGYKNWADACEQDLASDDSVEVVAAA